MAKEPDSVGSFCVEFYDEEDKVSVNLSPFAETPFIPRIGERVVLPGEEMAGAGIYIVTNVQHSYREGIRQDDHPGACPAHLARVTLFVKKIER